MTVTPRFFMGKYGQSNAMGLKTSLSTYDVTDTAGDNDPGKRSFNSQWTDLVGINQAGTISNLTTGTNQVLLSPAIAYIPFFEVRPYDSASGIVYDDRYWYETTSGYHMSSLVSWITASHDYLNIFPAQNSWSGTGKSAMYVVFKKQAN